MYCKHCGHLIDNDAIFCSSCGRKQHYDVTAEPTTASPQQPAPPFSYATPTQAETPHSNNRPVPSVTFGEAIRLMYTRAFDFSGRSVRSEYWYGFLYNSLMGLFLSVPGLPSWLGIIWSIIYFIPGLSMTLRRLHDAGRSGSIYWLFFISEIILIILSSSWIRNPFDESLYIFMVLFAIAVLAMAIWFIVQLCRDSVGDNEWGLSPYSTADERKSNTTVNSTATHQWRCSCGQLISMSPCPYCGMTSTTDISESALRKRIEQELIRPELDNTLAELYRHYLQTMYTNKDTSESSLAWQAILDECDARERTDTLAVMLEHGRKQLGFLDLWRCPGCGKVLPRTKIRCDACRYESPRPHPAPPVSVHKDVNGRVVCPVCHTIQHGDSCSCYSCGQVFINNQPNIPYWCAHCGKEGPYLYECPVCGSSGHIHNR